MTDTRAVPRVSEPVDDTTSLDGSRIDVGARIGWLLRVSRTAASLSLREMSAALEGHGVTLSAASLSRIESEGQRSVAALEGYARVLGLPEGTLRVPVDTVCRSFSYGPPAHVPLPDLSLAGFDRVCRAVDDPAPTAPEWLEFSRLHASPVGFGLPTHLMEPYVRRLALELCRSVGLARWMRYEALRGLRCSAYAHVVASVVADVLRDPDLHVTEDLVNVVAERPTAEVVAWAGALLRDPSFIVARSATYALQGMLATGGLDLQEWRELPPALDLAWSEAADDPARREILARLYAALPPPLQEQVAVARPRPETSGPRVWTRTRQNRHYGFATSLAHTVTSEAGLPDDPMLTRLVFEAMFDPRGVRMASAIYLLAGSPFIEQLVRILLARRDDGPDDACRPAATRVAAFCHVSGDLPDIQPLLQSGCPQDFKHALTIYGRGGHRVPDAVVHRGLGGDEVTVRCTLAALGLTGDPRLVTIASDPARPAYARSATQWWLRQGPRIVS